MKYLAAPLLCLGVLGFAAEADAQSADCSDVCIACCGGGVVDGPSALMRLFQKATTLTPPLPKGAPLVEPSPNNAERFGDELIESEEDNRKKGIVALSIDGRVGGTVGNALLVPIAYAFPGGSGQLRAQYRLGTRWFIGLNLSGAIGAGDEGAIGGYRAMARVGFTWKDSRRFTFGHDFHFGLASYSLIPLPRSGINTFVEFRPLVIGDTFNLFVGANAYTDIHLIAFAPGGGIAGGAELNLGNTVTTLSLNAGGEALVAVLVNSIGGTASAALSFGFRF